MEGGVDLNLLCFHCAGGSSSMFKRWEIEGVNVIPLDLPGRGKQINFPLVDDFTTAAKFLVHQVEKIISDGKAWGVIGHSMGAFFAYEVTRCLSNRNPLFRILSGVNPLQEYKGTVRLTGEDDRMLIQKVGALGGIPVKFLKKPMFVKWFAPILRADMSLVETFNFQKDPSFIPTYVINGDDDAIIAKKKIDLWSRCMNNVMNITTIKGGHFEILNHPEKVYTIIKSTFNEVYKND